MATPSLERCPDGETCSGFGLWDLLQCKLCAKAGKTMCVCVRLWVKFLWWEWDSGCIDICLRDLLEGRVVKKLLTGIVSAVLATLLAVPLLAR